MFHCYFALFLQSSVLTSDSVFFETKFYCAYCYEFAYTTLDIYKGRIESSQNIFNTAAFLRLFNFIRLVWRLFAFNQCALLFRVCSGCKIVPLCGSQLVTLRCFQLFDRIVVSLRGPLFSFSILQVKFGINQINWSENDKGWFTVSLIDKPRNIYFQLKPSIMTE